MRRLRKALVPVIYSVGESSHQLDEFHLAIEPD